MSSYEPQRMLPRHFRILELALTGKYSARDIAQDVGMDPTTVGIIMKSPLFQSELARRRSDQEKTIDEETSVGSTRARAILEEAATTAATTTVELLAADSPKIRLSAAESILNRVLGKTEESSKPSVTINVESMQILQTALSESGVLSPRTAPDTTGLEIATP